MVFKWKSLSKTFINYGTFVLHQWCCSCCFYSVQTFESVKQNLHFVTIQMKAAQQIFSCCTGYYAVITRWFELLSLWKKILQCNHSYESCGANFSCCADDNVQTFGSVDEILKHVSIQMKATMQFFPVVWFINFYIIVQVTVPWLFKHKLGYWLLVSFGSLYSLK